MGVDGCSAPVFAVPLAAAARIFANVTNRNSADGVPEAQRVAARRVCAALRERPEMIAGTKRLDTELIRATAGRLVSKVGAEGLWCAGVSGENAGLAVKCEDGSALPAYWVGLTATSRGATIASSTSACARSNRPARSAEGGGPWRRSAVAG